MKRAVCALLLTFPSHARAAGSLGPEYSFFSSFVQMIAALSIVIGLILVTRHFADKVLKTGSPGGLASRHIRVVETRAIAPKKALVLIEVGGEYLLLASSENGLSLLKQVEVFEDIEVLEEGGGTRQNFLGLFRRNAAQRRS